MKLPTSIALAVLALAPANAFAMSPSAFHQKAMSGDVFEIQSARLALQRSDNPAVRNFARTLIEDHREAAQVMNQGRAPVVAGSAMTRNEQIMLDRLQSASGRSFDRKFKQMQIQAHRKAIGMYESFADARSDHRLGQVARQTLPTLKKHLATAERLQLR